MARKATNNTSKTTSRARTKKPIKISNVATLEATRDQAKRSHLLAPKTTQKYDEYVARGREFLQELVKSIEDDIKTTRNLTKAERTIQLQDLQRLSQAFDPTPNSQSARALELFMTEKCFAQGRGMATASGIHAGFKKYWDRK